MRKIQNKYLKQLFMQEKFVPLKKRKLQLEAAEELFSIIEDDKDYPFEFVCFKITGFHPKGLETEPIKGQYLKDDLYIFLNRLSSQVADDVSELKEKVYTVRQLAEKLQVSQKTINRWRKKGLLARKFIFEDGKKKVGILQSALDDFLDHNKQLVQNAASFERMSKRQRQNVINKISHLAQTTDYSRHKIIEMVASEYERSHETIRCIVKDYESANPDNELFKRYTGPLSPSEKSEMFKLYQQDTPIRKLINRYGKSKSTIYRIINRKRARLILARKIDYIPSGEFERDDSEKAILSDGVDINIFNKRLVSKGNVLKGNFNDNYQPVGQCLPKLNRETEKDLFRKYNYLKYLAAEKKEKLNFRNISGRTLTEIENLLGRADKIKQILIKSNLDIVVTISRKHAVKSGNISELISEGNMSLLKSIEKFDYTRGFRFSTYASWVITTDFARKLPAAGESTDMLTASIDSIQKDHRVSDGAGVVIVERAHQNLVEMIKHELDDREQYIILNHFGLIGSPVNRTRKTLKEIGDHLGFSKERIRQLELTALQKLKRSLSMEEFELLTK